MLKISCKIEVQVDERIGLWHNYPSAEIHIKTRFPKRTMEILIQRLHFWKPEFGEWSSADSVRPGPDESPRPLKPLSKLFRFLSRFFSEKWLVQTKSRFESGFSLDKTYFSEFSRLNPDFFLDQIQIWKRSGHFWKIKINFDQTFSRKNLDKKTR